MLKKLRIKFVAAIMVIVTVMLCAVFGMVYYFTAVNMERSSILMMQNMAENPFHPGIPDMPGEEPRLPYFIVDLDFSGDIMSTSGGYYDLSDTDFLEELVRTATAGNQPIGVIDTYALRYFRCGSPRGQVIVFADTSSERATLTGLAKTCALLGALCFFAFLGISVLLARWMVKPVDAAWHKQRQFVSDASHELKTPLAVIMTNAELLQGADNTEADRQQFSASILTMSRQMRALVEQLLELARVDNGQKRAELCPLDFSQLAERALLPFEPLFFEKGLTLASGIQPGITLSGNAQQLSQLLGILLDNAQKYALPQSEVRLSLRAVNSRRCCLTVSNAAEELSPEQLENLFTRFYRVDTARSRDGSFGLGLSIAEGIVRAHKGKIRAEWADGRISFLAELPTKQGAKPGAGLISAG